MTLSLIPWDQPLRGVMSANPKNKDTEIHDSGFQPTHGANTEQEGLELRQCHRKA